MSALEEEQTSDDEEDSSESSRTSSPDEFDPRNLTEEQQYALAKGRRGLMILNMPMRNDYGSDSPSAAGSIQSISGEENEEEEDEKEEEDEEEEEEEEDEKEEEEEEEESESDDEEEEVVEEGNNDEKEPMSFNESQKIKRMWTILLPDSKQSPVGTCFIYVPLKPSIIHIDGGNPNLGLYWESVTPEQLLAIQEEIINSKKSRPQTRTYSDKDQNLRKKLKKKWTLRHEIMLHEDKWFECVRETSFDWEANLNWCGVPSPPVFFFDSDMNIRHISEYPHGLDQDPKTVRRTFRTSARHTSVFQILPSKPLGALQKQNAAFNLAILRLDYCDAFKYLELMTPEEVEQLRSLWWTEEQLTKMKAVLKPITGSISSGTTEKELKTLRDYEKEWCRLQQFFGEERLNFAYQRIGCQVAPIYFTDHNGKCYHYNDTCDGFPPDVDQIIWAREDPFRFIKKNGLLTSFSSTFWWIFEAPLEPMATHYLYGETHELSIYIALIDALDYLETNPMPEDNIAAQEKFLKKMFRKMKCTCHFKIEQANRLSLHFSIPSDQLVELARSCCVEHGEVHNESERVQFPQSLPNQNENNLQVDLNQGLGEASREKSRDGEEDNNDVPAPLQQQPIEMAPPRRLMDIMGDQFQVATADQHVPHPNYVPNLVLPGSLPSTNYGVDMSLVQPYLSLNNTAQAQPSLGFMNLAPYLGLANMGPVLSHVVPVGMNPLQSYLNLQSIGSAQSYINPVGINPAQQGQHGIANYMNGDPVNEWAGMTLDVWNSTGGIKSMDHVECFNAFDSGGPVETQPMGESNYTSSFSANTAPPGDSGNKEDQESSEILAPAHCPPETLSESVSPAPHFSSAPNDDLNIYPAAETYSSGTEKGESLEPSSSELLPALSNNAMQVAESAQTNSLCVQEHPENTHLEGDFLEESDDWPDSTNPNDNSLVPPTAETTSSGTESMNTPDQSSSNLSPVFSNNSMQVSTTAETDFTQCVQEHPELAFDEWDPSETSGARPEKPGEEETATHTVTDSRASNKPAPSAHSGKSDGESYISQLLRQQTPDGMMKAREDSMKAIEMAKKNEKSGKKKTVRFASVVSYSTTVEDPTPPERSFSRTSAPNDYAKRLFQAQFPKARTGIRSSNKKITLGPFSTEAAQTPPAPSSEPRRIKLPSHHRHGGPELLLSSYPSTLNSGLVRQNNGEAIGQRVHSLKHRNFLLPPANEPSKSTVKEHQNSSNIPKDASQKSGDAVPLTTPKSADLMSKKLPSVSDSGIVEKNLTVDVFRLDRNSKTGSSCKPVDAATLLLMVTPEGNMKYRERKETTRSPTPNTENEGEDEEDEKEVGESLGNRIQVQNNLKVLTKNTLPGLLAQGKEDSPNACHDVLSISQSNSTASVVQTSNDASHSTSKMEMDRISSIDTPQGEESLNAMDDSDSQKSPPSVLPIVESHFPNSLFYRGAKLPPPPSTSPSLETCSPVDAVLQFPPFTHIASLGQHPRNEASQSPNAPGVRGSLTQAILSSGSESVPAPSRFQRTNLQLATTVANSGPSPLRTAPYGARKRSLAVSSTAVLPGPNFASAASMASLSQLDQTPRKLVRKRLNEASYHD